MCVYVTHIYMLIYIFAMPPSQKICATCIAFHADRQRAHGCRETPTAMSKFSVLFFSATHCSCPKNKTFVSKSYAVASSCREKHRPLQHTRERPSNQMHAVRPPCWLWGTFHTLVIKYFDTRFQSSDLCML